MPFLLAYIGDKNILFLLLNLAPFRHSKGNLSIRIMLKRESIYANPEAWQSIGIS